MSNVKGNTLHIDISEEKTVVLGVAGMDTPRDPLTDQEMGDFTSLGIAKD